MRFRPHHGEHPDLGEETRAGGLDVEGGRLYLEGGRDVAGLRGRCGITRRAAGEITIPMSAAVRSPLAAKRHLRRALSHLGVGIIRGLQGGARVPRCGSLGCSRAASWFGAQRIPTRSRIHWSVGPDVQLLEELVGDLGIGVEVTETLAGAASPRGPRHVLSAVDPDQRAVDPRRLVERHEVDHVRDVSRLGETDRPGLRRRAWATSCSLPGIARSAGVSVTPAWITLQRIP